MCLSEVYREEDHALLMEHTARVETADGKVILTDLFGRKKEIGGKVLSVDLEKNIIILQTEDCGK